MIFLLLSSKIMQIQKTYNVHSLALTRNLTQLQPPRPFNQIQSFIYAMHVCSRSMYDYGSSHNSPRAITDSKQEAIHATYIHHEQTAMANCGREKEVTRQVESCWVLKVTTLFENTWHCEKNKC